MMKALARRITGRGTFISYSQNGEDAIAHALLRNIKKGIYVDVGAYHPLLYSNTYAFYRRGWSGIVIDPNISLQPLYRILRRRDIFVHGGVGAERTVRSYFSFSDGAYNTFDAREAESCRQINGLNFLGETPVAVRPLMDILAEQDIQRVDFLNIDAEGLDLEVLESHNWDILPRVIAVESRRFNANEPMSDPVYCFLRKRGYVLAGLAIYTLLFIRE